MIGVASIVCDMPLESAELDSQERSKLAAGTARKPKKLSKADLTKALDGQSGRLMHLDLVGTAEAAEQILKVERARIGKWRRNGILLGNGDRIDFPEPITMFTTSAKQNKCDVCGTLYEYVEPKAGRDPQVCPNCGANDKKATVIPDHTKLAASPLWWADDMRALKKILDKNRPRD